MSRPRRRWSRPAPAALWRNTATGPAPVAAAQLICLRRSASRSSWRRSRSRRCIDEIGFGFMFAPRHHRSMAHVVGVRKDLAVRTIFNFLGPLTNPAGASRQLLGVSDRRYQETIAEALVGLGSERALVVAAEDGLDEISVSSPTRMIEVSEGGTEEWFAEPESFGLRRAPLAEVAGGSPQENAAAVRAVLEGREGPGADLVLLNAGAAIYLGGGADRHRGRRRCGPRCGHLRRSGGGSGPAGLDHGRDGPEQLDDQRPRSARPRAPPGTRGRGLII